MKNGCVHNHRCRYTDGFYCEDCHTWFGKNSATYRSDELLSSIWMVLNNIVVEENKAGNNASDALEMKRKIGINIKHENHEELIAEAEKIMSKYGKNADSAKIILK